jgi:hypothetical protein
VGVIGIAFFPEREAPMQAVAQPPPYYDDRPHSSGGPMPPRKAAPADAEASSRAPAAAPAAPESKGDARSGNVGGGARPEVRRGLGTEFGEQRFSNVGYTSFQRESSTQPAHIVELRYNDRQGLLALGIPVDVVHRDSEVSRRETADPFPRSRYAAPPPR